MLTSSDRSVVLPILKSIGANVYLVDVLEGGTFRYFAINWPEGSNPALPYRGSVIGKQPSEVFDAGTAATIVHHYRSCVQYRSNVQYERSFETPVGRKWISHFLAPIFDLTGMIVRIMGTAIDITPQKNAELAWQDALKRFRSLYNDAPAKLMTLDMNGMILSINFFGAGSVGYSGVEMVNACLLDFIPADDRRRAMHFFGHIRKDPDRIHHAEFHIVKKDGTLTWTSNAARVIESVDGSKVILIVSDDTTETREFAADLAYHASHDWLTGLVNRREFEVRLKSLIESASRDKGQHVFLWYLDLEGFRIINDTFGHAAGDEVLRQVGALLRQTIHEDETAARLGGDEFGILAVNDSPEEAEERGRGLCTIIDRHSFIWNDQTFNITTSIGIVPLIADESVNRLLSSADQACYAAKRDGQSRVRIYRALDAA